jgi:hypothetical protein
MKTIVVHRVNKIRNWISIPRRGNAAVVVAVDDEKDDDADDTVIVVEGTKDTVGRNGILFFPTSCTCTTDVKNFFNDTK